MRARTQSRLAAAASIALTVAIAGMVNYMAARHFRRSDWTRAQIYSLSDKTRAILSGLDKDLKITVFMIPGNDVYQFTDELLTQFRRYAPAGRLAIEMLDIDKQRDQAELLAKKYKIDLEDLRSGVVVFESGGKTKYVTKSELVEYDYRETPMGAEDQKVRAFKGEGAFASAVLTVTEGTQTQICFVKGHGEGDPEGFDEGGYASFAEELKRDNYQIKTLAALDKTGVPAACGVVVVGGPQRAWQKPEADALDRWLEGGGKAFLLVGPVFDRDLKKWSRTGLEDLLDKWGVKLGDNIVVDPDKVSPFEGPTVWATDTYGDHPAVKKLKGKITFWPVTREVRAAGKDGIDVSELVKTSSRGWGETNLAVFRREAPLAFDAATDVKGPVPVAVACEKKAHGTRMIVVGTPMLVENEHFKGLENVDFALAVVAWLANKEQLVAVGPKQPEHVKLILTADQLHSAAWLTILGLPLLGLALGGCVWWRRRS
ncbi:MAG TPA: DUF4350 domain-containing protein [Polyangia bacterium]|nr:DUF4350 domain-containing protein [Polyangia bacterium]